MNVLIITAKNIVKWSKCEVPLHICKKNRRLFNKQFREEKKNIKNYNYSDRSVFIQIQILLDRINRNQPNWNKNEQTHFQL